MLTKLDIQSPKNLIPLCPNHHKMTDAFDCNKLLINNSDDWMKITNEFLRDSKPTLIPKKQQTM